MTTLSTTKDPMEAIKLKANMLRHRAAHASKHYGRERAKYQFDIVVQNVENLPDVRSTTASMLVSCARGPKLAVTTEADSTDSKASWNEKVSFVCTMYDSKKPERRWSEKLYRLSVQLVTPGEFGTHKKKLKEVAFTELDVSQFANAGDSVQKDLTLRLGWAGKPLCYAMLRVLLSCQLVRLGGAGGHSASDARSISSELTDRSDGEAAEQPAEGSTVESERVRKAAAARNAKMAPLSSIRESLATKLSSGGSRAHGTPGSRAASRGGGEWEEEEEAGATGRGRAAGAAEVEQHSHHSLTQRSAVHSGSPAHDAHGGRGFGLPQPPLPPSPLPQQPAAAASPSAARGAGASELAVELVRASGEVEVLRAQLEAAAEQRRQAEAEAAHLRERVRALSRTAQEATAAAEEAAAEARAAREQAAAGESARRVSANGYGGGRGAGGHGGSANGGLLSEQQQQLRQAERVAEGLRAALAEAEAGREEAEAGRAELAKELERSEHVAAKLRLALAEAHRRSAADADGRAGSGHGGGGGSGGAGSDSAASSHAGSFNGGRQPHGGESGVEVTELQLALVDAKMQLATMEFEREEAMHKVHTLRQELERTSGGSMKVAKEMTWLEVKYTEARSELARLKVHAASLEDDLREVIALKLELAEAQQRIAELEEERQEADARGGYG